MILRKTPKRPNLVSIRDQIYDSIKELILTNSFQPGELLHIDRLAEEYGVSTTPIREAMIRLESFGLVTLVPNKGARVSEIGADDIEHTWDMRLLLEPYAARVTAGLRIGSQLFHIRSKIEWILQGNYDLTTYIETDLGLHEQLYFHLPNPFFMETVQRVHQLSMRMRYVPEGITQISDTIIHDVSKEHIAIIDSLLRGDPDGSAENVYAHIRRGKDRALACMSPKMGERPHAR